jgi:hypothetical protein
VTAPAARLEHWCDGRDRRFVAVVEGQKNWVNAGWLYDKGRRYRSGLDRLKMGSEVVSTNPVPIFSGICATLGIGASPAIVGSP